MYWLIFGIRSTFDWTWRANSRSTFSRSPRIGSKICERAGDDFSTAFRVKTLSRPEQGVEVGRRARRQVAWGYAAHLRQGRDDARHVRRLVPLAAVRHRREKRAVGFGQEPIEGHAAGGLAQRLRLRKCNDPGQRDEQPQGEPGVGQRRIAGEAVQHAADLPAALLTKNRDRVLVRLACMD